MALEFLEELVELGPPQAYPMGVAKSTVRASAELEAWRPRHQDCRTTNRVAFAGRSTLIASDGWTVIGLAVPRLAHRVLMADPI